MGIQINGNTNNINAGIGSLSIEDINELDIVGVATAANFKTGVSNLHNVGLTLSGGQIDVGSNIKLGNAGVITATSFHGSGASLTGIDATALKDPAGNVKIQAQASGAVHTGIHTFSTVNTTHVTGNGSGLTNINASNISSGTIASARVPTLNQNTTGYAARAQTIDTSSIGTNSTYYPTFVDDNNTSRTLGIDGGLTYNPSTNILTAGTVRGVGTVQVHGYNLSNAGDVGHGSNYWSWNMTPTIPWNKVILGHTGAHRASNDTHYYWYYSFNKGNGFVDQITVGVGRAHMQTTHNQGGAYTGVAMESNGAFMSGNANQQCTFKMYLSTGGNSAPASDNGYDHHAWAMFIHS